MEERKITNDKFYRIFENLTIDDFCFIQIGANDGKTFDPLYELIIKNKNWRGILFEPGIQAFEELKLTYEGYDNLTLVNSAVSNFDGPGTLFCGKTTPHFTLNKRKAIDMFDIVPIEEEINVVSPQKIINDYNIKDIYLLQIDTEGHDFTILKSFLENNYLPLMLRFEHINLTYEGTNDHEVIKYLSKFGYESFYVKDDVDIVSILK
jgi:FkbM family methyltransferase